MKKMIAMLLVAAFLAVNVVGCNSGGSTTAKSASPSGSTTATKGGSSGGASGK
jgi:archaellin